MCSCEGLAFLKTKHTHHLNFVNTLVCDARLFAHSSMQNMSRLARTQSGAKLITESAAAASTICILGFASSVMRLIQFSDTAFETISVVEKSQQMPLMLDTHSVTCARADKSRDGYHYFEQPSELTDAAGAEVCMGNSVARVVARLVLKSLCPKF
jgi:hypothetical protein